MQDAAASYEIKTKISDTKQGNLSVTEKYNVMNGLWLELDHYHNLKMKCSKDTQILLEAMESNQIF